MSDRVLIPLPGLGVLRLTEEAFREALAAGADCAPAPAVGAPASTEPLLDANQAAALLGVTARWLEDGARQGIVPHYKLGRYIRFRVSDVATHCAAKGAPIPGTDAAATRSESVAPFRRLSRQ